MASRPKVSEEGPWPRWGRESPMNEWNARKHGGTKRRARHCPRTNGGQGSRRKIHIGIDEKSLEIRAAECTTSDVGDAPMLPELLDQSPPGQEIASVTADGAFDTRKCHDAIAARGAGAVRRGNGPPDHFLFLLTPAPQERQPLEA